MDRLYIRLPKKYKNCPVSTLPSQYAKEFLGYLLEGLRDRGCCTTFNELDKHYFSSSLFYKILIYNLIDMMPEEFPETIKTADCFTF